MEKNSLCCNSGFPWRELPQALELIWGLNWARWHMVWFLLPLTLFRLLVSQNRLSGGLSAEVSSYSWHFGDRALWAFCPVSPWEMWVRTPSCSFFSSWHPVLSSLLLVSWAWPGEFQILPALGGRQLPCARFHGWVKWKWDAPWSPWTCGSFMERWQVREDYKPEET